MVARTETKASPISKHRNRRGNDIDKTVGLRVRALRLQRGLSQTEVGNGVGVTFQQLQKYENGTNRISPSRLVALAKLFSVKVADLFADVDQSGNSGNGRADKTILEFAGSRQGTRFVRTFMKLTDHAEREILVQLAELFENAQQKRTTAETG